MAGKKVGVLAVQGAFLEHENALARCGVQAVEVRKVSDIFEVDALIIPGGESTAIGKILQRYELDKAIVSQVSAGMPLWGTCAGMILMAREIEDSNQLRLGLMDMRVKRNAFGRQMDSFETELEVEGLGRTRGIFIRAPYVDKVWGDTRILAVLKDKIVMTQSGANLLATAFHPELTLELDIHKYFLAMG